MLLGETKPHYETVRRALLLLLEEGVARRIAGRGRNPDKWCAADPSSPATELEDDSFASMLDGLCVRCGRDAVNGSQYCLRCLQEANQ